jgi:hypothetical protein
MKAAVFAWCVKPVDGLDIRNFVPAEAVSSFNIFWKWCIQRDGDPMMLNLYNVFLDVVVARGLL